MKERCSWKTVKGDRCRKEFYPRDGESACHVHRDRTHWNAPEIGSFKDVAILIGNYIDDPTTFYSFSRVCKSMAKASLHLRQEKMNLWRKLLPPLKQRRLRNYRKLEARYILPNGSIVDVDNNFLKRCGRKINN